MWKRLSQEDKFVNPYWTYRFETFELPTGEKGEYHYLHTKGGSVMVLPEKNGKFVMLHQYRYLFDKTFIEFPAGGVDSDTDTKQAARRELIEETGYDGDLEYLGKFVSLNGITDEWTYVYKATNLKPSSEFTSDITEAGMEVKEYSKEEIEEGIRNGIFEDGMTNAAWALYKSKQV